MFEHVGGGHAGWSVSSRVQHWTPKRAFCGTGQMRLFGLPAVNITWAFSMRGDHADLFYVGPFDAFYRLHRELTAELRADAFTYDETPSVADLGVRAPLVGSCTSPL